MVIFSKDDAVAAVQVVLDKKAYDVVLLDITNIVAYADFFLICSGRSIIQTRAIANALETYFGEQGKRPLHIEGYTQGQWVLLDYDELIVHVFVDEARNFYQLERLWKDAPMTKFEDYVQPRNALMFDDN